MASYTKSTNFATKDSLPTGDPAKVVKGTEIDTEYNNIETAVNSKPDANSGTHTGTTSMASVSVSSGLTTADLTATGTSTISDADVSTLDVTGTSTLADADVTTLDVTGTSTLADADITTLNVSGDTTLVGDLTVDTDTLHVDSTNNLVGIGITTDADSTTGGPFVQLAANDVQYFRHNHDSRNLINLRLLNQSSTGFFISFQYNGNSPVGSITTDGSTTSYNTGSDYRLKENIQPVQGASTELKRLKPSRFNFIGSDVTKYGFIAHEVQEVVPEAVTGEKDGEEYQGMDASKLVPVLTAALQEALQRIEDLEAKIG